MSKKIIFSLLGGVMIFSLSACGGKSLVERNIENQLEKNLGGTVDVNLENNGFKVETEQGITIETGENLTLPTDFPTDVFISNGELISAMENGMNNGFQVVLKTTDSMQNLEKIYEEKLVEDGWKINQTANLSELLMIEAKKEKRTVSVTISPDTEDMSMNLIMVNVFEL